MLVRSLKANPWLLVFLVACALFGYQLSFGTEYVPPPPEPAPPAPAPKEDAPPPPPPGPRIAVVTFVTDQRSYLHLSLKNKDHYARRHGYDFIVDYEAHTPLGTTHWKFNMMDRLVRTGRWDWIWWLDFDTLITNTDIALPSIIDTALGSVGDPAAIDVLTTHDCNGLNTGSFILRGHERSLEFLGRIYEEYESAKKSDDKEELSEQDAMARLIRNDPAMADRTRRVPQWQLNAFPEEIKCYSEGDRKWQHGDFVVHFAGAWAHVKGEDPTGVLMKKYEREIIWGDTDKFY